MQKCRIAEFSAFRSEFAFTQKCGNADFSAFSLKFKFMHKSRNADKNIAHFWAKNSAFDEKFMFFQNAEMQNFLHFIKILKTCKNAEMQRKINQIFG